MAFTKENGISFLPSTTKYSKTAELRSAVRDAMELEYRSTTMVSEFPSCVSLLTQLVTNFKELKFGCQGSTSFESCHRGISPFSVPSSSLEVHRRLRALEEDTELATTTTLVNIWATRTLPPTCPGDYYCWDSVIHELDHCACGGRTRLYGRLFCRMFCSFNKRIGTRRTIAISEPSYIHLTSLE